MLNQLRGQSVWRFIMGNMHKETICRRKLASLIKLFTLILIVLFFTEVIEGLYIGSMLIVLTGALVTLVLVLEVTKCRVRYTYSLIADQFIIHRIKGNDDKVVENIKVKDIEYIEKQKTINITTINNKKYICSLLNFNPYCCVYRQGDKLKKFYFEPSNNLIEKLKFNRNKRLAS